MKWTAIARHRAGTTFVLIFFFLFATLSTLVVADAVHVYRGIARRADSTQSNVLPLLHLSGAARRAQTTPSIVQLDNGTEALCLRENGKLIYYSCRDGYLYKQVEGVPDQRAERLCPAGSLHLKYIENVIRADYIAPDGTHSTLLLAGDHAGGEP